MHQGLYDQVWQQNCDIRLETEHLEEFKDILDELNIIMTVLHEQKVIFDEAMIFLSGFYKEEEGFEGALIQRENTHELERNYRAFSKLDAVIQEVERLRKDAQRVQDNVNATLMRFFLSL